MSRDYNEQAPDGSWRHVVQDDSGHYTTTPIPPSGYQAANIPGSGPSSTDAASFTNPDGTIDQAKYNAYIAAQGSDTALGFTSDQGLITTTPEKLAWLDSQNGGPGSWHGDRSDAGVQAAYAAAQQGSSGGPEAFNPAYYQAVQAGIDKTIANALAAANGQVSAAVDAANNIRGLLQTYGDQALGFLKTAGDLGVSVADVMSRLTGPANAFAYDRAATAFRGNGLGSSVQALTSGFAAPSFGAMGPTSPMTLDTMGQDVSGHAAGNGPGIIDQLLGLAGTAEQGYNNAGKGIVPFSIPQLDANGHVIPSTVQGTQTTTPPAGGSDGVYQTSNGPKTVAQMLAELDVAAGGHWNDGDRNSATAIASAYAHTTGGTVTPPQTATAGRQTATYQNPNPIASVQPTGPASAQAVAGTGSGTGTQGTATVPPGGFQVPTMGGGNYTGDQAYLNQYSPQAQQFLLGLPNPGDINPRDWNASDPYSQALDLAGLSAKGYDPTQVQFQLSKELPASAGPRFGLVSG